MPGVFLDLDFQNELVIKPQRLNFLQPAGLSASDGQLRFRVESAISYHFRFELWRVPSCLGGTPRG